jgi:nitrite reductase (NADH) large subunit
VRPRTQLASACGLSRSPEGGVIVDDALRTSDPAIFAVGECASHRSQIYGLVAPGYEMADALALILAGSQASFRGASPSTRLKLLGVEVATAGDALDRGFAVRFHTATAYRLVRVERGRLVGALGVGEWPELRRVQEAAARHGRVWPWQVVRFARTGILWQRDADPAVADWPAHAVVCNCLNVTHGRIMAACAERAVSVESVVERTGASTLCGTCRPLLAQLVEGRAPSPRLATGLLAGSLAALGIAIAILTVTPIPLAGSIQAPSWADVLWRDGTNRQISGFVLLALMVLTSSLTLRRRWRRLSSVGTYATWRIAHVLLGIGTLAGVAVHTGARLGDNLTFVLMACFGALNVAGAAAGGLTALEARVGTPSVRRYRAALVTVHIAAIWPLPILIAFHVLTVFYF